MRPSEIFSIFAKARALVGSSWSHARRCGHPSRHHGKPIFEAPNATRLRRFREAVEALPEPARSVFWAHSVDDLPYQAIAERLDLDMETVQRALADALSTLSAAIDDE
jgi:RNA polymerase sigma factor (sigma-70 family)